MWIRDNFHRVAVVAQSKGRKFRSTGCSMNADEESTFDLERKVSASNTNGRSADIKDDCLGIPSEASIPERGASANYGRYIPNVATNHAPVTSRNAPGDRSANYGYYLNRSRAP